jgi:nicotinamidase-related amidase
MPAALLVIDMQVGSFGKDARRHDVPALIGRLNGLARRVRDAGGTVIFVQHDGPTGDPHHPGQPGWAILPELEKLPGDLTLRKTACDSFLNTDLERVLAARGLRELIVTGCATDYCVDTTIRAALARGYRTIVPSDGHTTAERPHLTATKIIEHHNAIWRDFIAPVGPAHVCACAEVAL